MRGKHKFIFIGVIMGLISPVWSQGKDFETSVMTFNVENLFDNIDDPGKADETYLPKPLKTKPEYKEQCKKIRSKFHRKECFTLDWSEEVLEAKLKNVARVILSVEEGKGPDNLFLVEVENEKILTQLNEKYLKAANYKTMVLIEGTDPRGIDIAFLSRYPLMGKPILHPIKFITKSDKTEKTRGILEVPIIFPNAQKIHFLGVHFPSQGNPSYLREQALSYLRQLLLENKKQNIIAGGDFNITEIEERRRKYFTKILAPLGLLSHFDACESCQGTHWYKGHWSFLDALFFNQALSENGWKLDKKSVDVVKKKSLHFDGQKPIRFDEISLKGVSDHLPVYARLKWNKK